MTYTNIADLEFVVRRPRLFPISSHLLVMLVASKILTCTVLFRSLMSLTLPIMNHFAVTPKIYTGTAIQRGHSLHISTARGHRVVVNIRPLRWEVKQHYGDSTGGQEELCCLKYVDSSQEKVPYPVHAGLSRHLKREVVELV
jgi:hypothetical protein